MRKRTLIAILFIVSNILHAQTDINLEKVQGEGLTNYYIKCIQQDTKGFLWFGTEEGLFRYDGYSYQPFKNFPGDPQTLINNNIEFLFPERNLLWVGSRGGLSCIDINTNAIRNFSPGELVTVYAVLSENDSTFWIGTSAGLFQFNKRNASWKRITSVEKNVFIRSLCDDGKNHLYITSHDGFFCYDKIAGTCRKYLLPSAVNETSSFQIFHKSLLDNNGILWMTTWMAGLIEFDPHTGKIKEWLYNKDDLKSEQPYLRAFDIFQNTDGKMWMANSEKGLTIFNPADHNIINYPIAWDNEMKSINKTYSLFRDRSGICWVGTENGIYKYDPHMVHLSKINFILKSDTGNLKIPLAPLCMLKDRDGFWWVGTYQGLYLFDAATGVLHDCNIMAGIPKSTLVTNILEDSGSTIWISAGERIIALNKKRSGKIFSFQHALFVSPGIQSAILCMYIDDKKKMWIGTNRNGIFMFDLTTKKIIAYAYNDAEVASNENPVRCFYEISGDSLLVGGEHSEFLLLHTNNGRYEKILWNSGIAGLAHNLTINSIIKNNNSLWIATDFDGLWQTDIHFQNVKRYTIHDGLPSMNISAVMADSRNHLWLLTEGGVVDFQPRNSRLKLYDKKDGLQNLSCLWSVMQCDLGNIAISDLGCIHLFNPVEIIKNNKPPEIMITKFKIFDKEYPVSSDQVIRLNYDQNYFSFEYVALNYTQPSLNGYAYKLEGLDGQWNNAGTRRYVSYAGLKEGTYTFKVKACNNEGVWNNVPASITLVIAPPWWHTWWFYLLVVLCITGIFYSIYLMKLHQWKIRYQLRNKIARDLHDDIGSTLSGINIFSKIALQKMHTDEAASGELLQKISERSKKTMDALSDIVWSINTKNDDMDNVLEKMQEYLSETLEAQNIQYNFKTDESIHHTRLDMEVRKELYLIFKEAIYNACKYAQCDYISIFLKRKKDTCTLTIQDNGKGFDIKNVTPGNGIHNMRQRAIKMKATISITSEINKGTLISLNFHIT